MGIERVVFSPPSGYNQAFAMPDARRGLVLVNTGPGKGKTTAAVGTALRAVQNGMRVLMLQFLKGSWRYWELDAAAAFGDKFVLKQMGRGGRRAGHPFRPVGHGHAGRDQLRHQAIACSIPPAWSTRSSDSPRWFM